MVTVELSKTIPENSIIIKGIDKFHYFDSYRINIDTNQNIDSILKKVFKLPLWVTNLMKVRNAIAGSFGLKTGLGKEEKYDTYQIGKRAVFFTVIDRNENEIVMGENDKHLYFRTSLMLETVEIYKVLYLTTLVRYNNIWGRMYFIPVKPFHRLIMKTLLKNLKNKE
jgi:hypothetical protein